MNYILKGMSIFNDFNKIDFNDEHSKYFCNKKCYLFTIWLFILSMSFTPGLYYLTNKKKIILLFLKLYLI